MTSSLSRRSSADSTTIEEKEEKKQEAPGFDLWLKVLPLPLFDNFFLIS